MEHVEIIYCPSVLVRTLRGRFYYVTFLWVIAGDCTITLSAIVSMLVHP